MNVATMQRDLRRLGPDATCLPIACQWFASPTCKNTHTWARAGINSTQTLVRVRPVQSWVASSTIPLVICNSWWLPTSIANGAECRKGPSISYLGLNLIRAMALVLPRTVCQRTGRHAVQFHDIRCPVRIALARLDFHSAVHADTRLGLEPGSAYAPMCRAPPRR